MHTKFCNDILVYVLEDSKVASSNCMSITTRIFHQRSMFNNFFELQMTSEVKDQFYKVMDNPMEYVCKKFVRISFKVMCYYGMFMELLMSLKGQSFNQFYRVFIVLWVQRL